MNTTKGVLLVVYHLLALSAFALPMPPSFVLAGAAVFVAVGLGTTLGLHRKLTHRSFHCPRWLEYTLVTLAAVTLQTHPLAWVANHRIHHGNTDQEGDPHSPRWGFWYSHLGWVVDDLSTDPEAYRTFCRDLADDRYYLWLRRFSYVPHVVALGLVVVVAGWEAVPCVLYLPLKTWMHTSYAVNSVCHSSLFGRRAHETPDGSRNVWWVGVIGLGEGWHNNHHAAPRSPMFGQRLWQLDIGGLVLRGLFALGLATPVTHATATASSDAAGQS